MLTPSDKQPSRVKVIPAAESCKPSLLQLGGFTAKVDSQTNAYGRRLDLTDGAAVQSLYFGAAPSYSSGAPLGASGFVLGSQMHQNIEAENSKDVAARVGSIAAAIRLSTSNLAKSYSSTRQALEINDADIASRLAQSRGRLQSEVADAKQRALAIRAVPRETLPARTSQDEPFIAAGTSMQLVTQAVLASVPPEHVRADGRDLLGVLARSSTPGIQGQIASERAKVAAAHARGQVSEQGLLRLKTQFDAAASLAGSSDPKGRQIAESVIADTESERQVLEGKASVREVTTVDAEGNLSATTQASTEPAPESEVGQVVGRLYLRIGVAHYRTDAAVALADGYGGLDRERRREVAAAAVTMSRNADDAWRAGRLGDVELWTDLAIGTADLVTAWVPWLSVPRGLYELASGRDAFSGKELTDLELAGRAIDIATIGIGSKLFSGWRVIDRIATHVGDSARYKKIAASAEKYAARMTKLGRNPLINAEDLTHIVDSHMPGGVEVAAGEVKALATEFLHDVDPLELAGDAVELVANKADAVRTIGSRSKGASEFVLWDRTGLGAIGRGVKDDAVVESVGVVLNKSDGRLINIYPWHPKNKVPLNDLFPIP